MKPAIVLALLAVSGCRPESGVHEVTIRNFRFDPETVSVAAGDTVRWRNADLAPHTATSAAGEWDSGSIGAGQARQTCLLCARRTRVSVRTASNHARCRRSALSVPRQSQPRKAPPSSQVSSPSAMAAIASSARQRSSSSLTSSWSRPLEGVVDRNLKGECAHEIETGQRLVRIQQRLEPS